MIESLQEITRIDPSKECLKFLAQRLQSNDYRGLQISQHNRYTKKEILVILGEIYNLVGSNLMQIRTTDLSKRPQNIAGEEQYAQLTNNISLKLSRCTQDSLRKNIFVDMHRMGLISRYNAKKEPLNPFANGTKKFISLTQLGIALLQENNLFTQNLLFTRALENLLNGFGEEILSIALDLQQSPYISEEELLFFGTFLNQKLGDTIFSRSVIIEFIKEYRTLSKFQQKMLVDKVQTYCNPNNFSGDKTNKRDFHNWLNETQQIITLLSQMSYFEYAKESRKLCIKIGTNDIYEDSTKLKRSLTQKQAYFSQHSVSKTKGFELHHIVPLCWARSRVEFQTLDNWQNLVYIDAFSHAKITQNNNANVRLSFLKSSAIFSDFKDNKIECKKDLQILYDENKQNIMLEYNHQLLHATSKNKGNLNE